MFACEYVHSNGASIFRASQPKVGFMGSRNRADEQLFQKFANAGGGSVVVLDARPNLSALANVARGGGVEPGSRYGGKAVQYLGIDNIHVVRSGHNKINDFQDPLAPQPWLKAVSSVLNGALKLAGKVEESSSVLLHCSDGWDRTPQVICVGVVLLASSARSLIGFCGLVQRSWVFFGHKFGSRYGHHGHPTDEISPIFPQFCDCMYQLMVQNPAAFEFNAELLEFLADTVYTGNYIDFSLNSDHERSQLLEKSGRDYGGPPPPEVSVWNYILQHQDYFMNSNYDPASTSDFLEVDSSVDGLRLWREYHYRWSSALL